MSHVVVSIVTGLLAAAGGLAVGLAVAGGDDLGLEREVEPRLEAMERRLQELERTPEPATAARRAAPRRDGLDAFRRELTDLRARVDGLEGDAVPTAGKSSGALPESDDVTELIDARIAAAAEQRKQTEEETRRRAGRKRALARARNRAVKVGQAMSLHPDQTDRLAEAMLEHEEANAGLWPALKDDSYPAEDRLSAITSLRENRVRFQDSLRGFLTNSQVDEFNGIDGKGSDRIDSWLETLETSLREDR